MRSARFYFFRYVRMATLLCSGGLAVLSCEPQQTPDLPARGEVEKISAALASPEIAVFVRDETLGSTGRSQPRIYLENLSSTALTDFKVYYYLTAEGGATPTVAPYWVPGSQVTIERASGETWRVAYDFAGSTLSAGGLVPDPSGNVVGLAYAGAGSSGWNADNDWSHQGVTSSFTQNNYIVVVDRHGLVVAGQSPPGVSLEPATEAGVDGGPMDGGDSTGKRDTGAGDTGTGSAGQANTRFIIQLPSGVARGDIALGTTGGALDVEDGVQLISSQSAAANARSHASVSAVAGGGVSRLGVQAEVWDIFGETEVNVADRAWIFGSVRGGTVAIAPSAHVAGSVSSGVGLGPLQSIEWNFTFPSSALLALDLQPDTEREIPPGDYGAISVMRGATLTLRAGTYSFASLMVEPGAVLRIANVAPVFVYVRNSMTWRGILERDTEVGNVLFSVAGAEKSILDTAFSGFVVAPNSLLELATLPPDQSYRGSFFAKELTVRPWTRIEHEPLLPEALCDGSTICSSLCPCGVGQTCEANAQCQTGLTCATRSSGIGSCVTTGCETTPGARGCTSPPELCTADSDCAAPERCEATRVSIGGHPVGTQVCLNPALNYCFSDAECAAGSICISGAGDLFGYPSSTSACIPVDCFSSSAESKDCGSTDAACGTYCSAPLVSCEGRACGVEPRTGVSCGQCSSGAVCDLGGQCLSPEPEPELSRFLLRAEAFEVGAITGDHEVSPNGKSTYRIPLNLPKAAGGLTPELALVFRDASQTRGTLGPNWALEGASKVHRCSVPSYVGRLGVGSPVRAQDPLPKTFCVDGRTLVPSTELTAAEGGNTRAFRFADNDGSKVVQYLNAYDADGPTEDQNSYFKVFKPNGVVFIYEEQIHARDLDIDQGVTTSAISEWNVTEVRDRFDNLIKFQYEGLWSSVVPSATYLTEILYSWTHAGVRRNTRQVRLRYQDKADRAGGIGGHRLGMPQDDSRLLAALEIDTFDLRQVNDSARTYELEYEFAPSSGLQRVQAVYECAVKDGVKSCLPPTQFEYDDAPREPGQTMASRFGAAQPATLATTGNEPLNFATWTGLRPRSTLSLDADGDGYRDLLQATADGSAIRYWHAVPVGGVPQYPVEERLELGGATPDCILSVSIGDIDRDGRDEILDSCGWVTGKDHVEYYKINGLQLEAIDTGIATRAPAYFADLDADGMLDIVQETPDRVFLSALHGFLDDEIVFHFTSQIAAPGAPATMTAEGAIAPFLLDVDGDGVANLLRFDDSKHQFLALSLKTAAQLTPEESAASELLPDQVGPGLVTQGFGTWKETDLAFERSPADGGVGYIEAMRIMDINGDGLPDVWYQRGLTLAPLNPDILKRGLPGIPKEDLLIADFSAVIGDINDLLGGRPITGVEAGPSLLWINEGGRFVPKPVEIAKHSDFDLSKCEFKFDNSACVMGLDPELFRASAAFDYDGDGFGDLVFQEPTSDGFGWFVARLMSEGREHISLEIERISDLPAEGSLYQQLDQSGFNALWVVPLWEDLNGDGAKDFLAPSTDGSPALAMGIGDAPGHHLVGVTDGLGNRLSIERTSGTAAVALGGKCGKASDIDASPVRCIAGTGAAVTAVETATSTGHSLGRTEFAYHYPTRAPFLSGAFFQERSLRALSGSSNGGPSQVPLSTTTELYEDWRAGSLVEWTYTYPFVYKPTFRETELVEAPDALDASRYGRTVREYFTYSPYLILSEAPVPFLEESWLIVRDRLASGYYSPNATLEVHETFTVDEYARQTSKLTETLARDRRIAGTYEYVSFPPVDPTHWVLNTPEYIRAGSTRNSVDSDQTSRLEYDASGSLKTIFRDFGSNRELATDYAYDAYGNLASLTLRDANNASVAPRTTRVDYGTLGLHPERTENAEGHIVSVLFDDIVGLPAVTEDENGYISTVEYDSFGRVASSTGRGGEVTFLYEPAAPYQVDGVPIAARYRRTTARQGAADLIETFDSRGLVVQTDSPALDPEGVGPRVTQEFEYDWKGRVTRESAPHGPSVSPQWTRSYYDEWERLALIESPKGSQQIEYSTAVRFASQHPEWDFDDAIGVVLTTDEVGKLRASLIDHNNLPVGTIDGLTRGAASEPTGGSVTRIVRGGQDRPATLIDPEGNETRIEYTPDGLVSEQTDLDRGRLINNYNAFGDLEHAHTAVGDVAFEYDRLGRRTGRVDADGTTEWKYDVGAGSAIGKITEATSPSGIVTRHAYEDTPRGLLESLTYEVGGDSYRTEYEYDALSRPTRTVYPVANAFTFATLNQYDAQSGQLAAVVSDDEQTLYWHVDEVDDAGRLKQVSLGNGVTERTRYDATSRLLASKRIIGVDDDELGRIDYTYYANNLIKGRNVTFGGIERARTVSYDAANRLESVVETGPDGQTDGFQFSAAGRLASRDSLGAYQYDAAHPNAISSAGQNTFTYDEHGNQRLRTGPEVIGGRQSIEAYSGFHLPTRILVGPDGAPTADYTFSYDADQVKIVSYDSTNGHEILTAGPGYERSTDPSGDIVHRYRIFAVGLTIAEVTHAELADSTAVVYLHRDATKSVLFTTDADGVASELRDFDALGAPHASPPWTGLTTTAYTGHHYEAGLGLLEMGARLYDPQFGVFTTPDFLALSSGRSAGLNPYAYANNDSINFFDPTGLQAEPYNDEGIGRDENGDAVVYVYGTRPWESMWERELRLNALLQWPRTEPLRDFYPLGSSGTLTCTLNGQCNGNSHTILAVPGQLYTLRTQQLTQGVVNFVAGIALVPQLSVLVDQNASGMDTVLAIVEIGAIIVPFERLAVVGAEAGVAVIRGAQGAAARGGRAVETGIAREATLIGQESGPSIVVPHGASGPTPAANGAGVSYTGGAGGAGMSSKVSGVRIMDPTLPKGPSPGYPGGYGSYSNAGGQTINPYTGQTIGPSDTWWHIPLK
jgi:RHS repeat-associated protein